MTLEYKVGDTITLKHPDGSRLVREVVTRMKRPAIDGISGAGYIYLDHMESRGWTVTVVEPALPTEDGWYEAEIYPLAVGYSPYRRLGGKWLAHGSRGYRVTLSEADMRPLGKLTRLAPVPELTEELVDEAVEKYYDGPGSIRNSIRAALEAVWPR